MSEPDPAARPAAPASYWEFVETAQARLSERMPQADLDANLTVLSLNRAAQAVTYDLESTLLRPQGWSAASYRLMFVLWNTDELEPSNLARLTGMTRAGVSNLTSALIERGLIARRPSATDGRGAVLSITEAGRAAITEIFRAHNEREAEWAALLTPQERATLQGLLGKLLRESGQLAPRRRYEPKPGS